IKLHLKRTNFEKSIQFNVYGFGEGVELLSEDINYFGKYSGDDVKEILKNNEVVVFLNKSGNAGGLSHSLLEAMASGKVIIAWDNYIHNQVLTNDNSILIPEGNIEYLSLAFDEMK